MSRTNALLLFVIALLVAVLVYKQMSEQTGSETAVVSNPVVAEPPAAEDNTGSVVCQPVTKPPPPAQPPLYIQEVPVPEGAILDHYELEVTPSDPNDKLTGSISGCVQYGDTAYIYYILL